MSSRRSFYGAELLTVVPHSMSTIDRLEAKGKFPKRIRLEPTNRVAWMRREVTGYLRHLAKRRQGELIASGVHPASGVRRPSSIRRNGRVRG